MSKTPKTKSLKTAADTTTMRGADIVVQCLEREGVEVVLGDDVLEILILIARIDAEEEVVVGDLVHQNIVHEPAVLVEKPGVVRLSQLQLGDGIGGDVVGEKRGFGTADFDLAHVADIEDAHRGAHRIVFVDDAGILDGHIPSTEIDHLRAKRAMDGVQGCGAETGRCWHENSG